MWPYGLMLSRYIGHDRLRLVHLIRHPVATCRSYLAADWSRYCYEDGRPRITAEMAAAHWIRRNACIREQFQAIADPSVCRVLRLEDASLATLRSLFAFLGLEGFDEQKISHVMNDTSKDVRHSHLAGDDFAATKEELQLIWQLCALAREYGYEEEPK